MSADICLIDFFIPGVPAAKQSFKYTRDGRRYQTQRVKDWQETVGWYSNVVARSVTKDKLRVQLDFLLKRDNSDLDNLAKAVLDGMQGIVYENDKQIVELRVTKNKSKVTGVRVRIINNGEL